MANHSKLVTLPYALDVNAKCKPRQENEQRRIEFHEEVSRLILEKPMVEPVGHYGITMIWPSGCSSGIHSFSHLRNISEDLGTKI